MEGVAALPVREYVEEAVNCLHNHNKEVTEEVNIFLISKTEEWLRKNNLPIPKLNFTEVIEIYGISLKLCGKEIWLTPQDSVESALEKLNS